jgi:selenocysteine lyase/cysteine desulfurase
MEWHSRQDRTALVAHNRKLTARVLEGVDGLGLALVSPRDPDQRGGSLMVRLPEDRPAATVLERFRRSDVHADARSQVLRLSPGFMTTADGVEHMLATLQSALAY